MCRINRIEFDSYPEYPVNPVNPDSDDTSLTPSPLERDKQRSKFYLKT
jgi:hypothetical protein